MLSSAALLAELQRIGVSQKDIAFVLGLAPSRISEMYAGHRRLQMDEGEKLVEHFKIDSSARISPLSLPIARLLVLHAAACLGMNVDPDELLVSDAARDFLAFLKGCSSDTQLLGNVDKAEGVLQGMRLRRDSRVE